MGPEEPLKRQRPLRQVECHGQGYGLAGSLAFPAGRGGSCS
jgi:hypothetical protein